VKRNRDRVPEGRRGGGYFGGQRGARAAPPSETLRRSEGFGFGGIDSSHVSSLESQLDPSLRALLSQDTIRRDELKGEQLETYKRYRVARKYARPVERTIAIYDDPQTDLYDVIGVSRSADDAEIKKAQRNLKKLLHPGD
jgi:hypothetical protein